MRLFLVLFKVLITLLNASQRERFSVENLLDVILVARFCAVFNTIVFRQLLGDKSPSLLRRPERFLSSKSIPQ